MASFLDFSCLIDEDGTNNVITNRLSCPTPKTGESVAAQNGCT